MLQVCHTGRVESQLRAADDRRGSIGESGDDDVGIAQRSELTHHFDLDRCRVDIGTGVVDSDLIEEGHTISCMHVADDGNCRDIDRGLAARTISRWSVRSVDRLGIRMGRVGA